MHIVKEISIFVQITIFCSKCWNKNEVCPDGKLDESYLSRLYFNLPFWVNNVTLPPYDINMKIIMPDMESNLSAGSQLVLRIPQAFVTTALKCSVSFCSTCSTISCQNDNTDKYTYGRRKKLYSFWKILDQCPQHLGPKEWIFAATPTTPSNPILDIFP